MERIVAKDSNSSPLGVKVRIRPMRIAIARLNARQNSALLGRSRSLPPGKSSRASRYPGTRMTRIRPKIAA